MVDNTVLSCNNNIRNIKEEGFWVKGKFQYALLLVLAMLLFACVAGAEEYAFNEDDYKVTAYSGAGGEVIMPEELAGCPVEIVDSSVFYGNETITSLTLPQTLLTLGSSNVYVMEQLETVRLPQSLIAIDDYNFYGCPMLESVVIPPSVSYIGEHSFFSCENLKEICFEGEVPAIAPECFQYLAEGAVARVPQDRLEAYRAALPAELEVVSSGVDAVQRDFTAPEDSFTFDAATGTIVAYNGFDVRVDIPASIGGTAVRAIGENAFYGHRYMYCVRIPEGVETIGAEAFGGTHHLSSVSLPSTLRKIGDGAFAQFRGKMIALPEELEMIGSRAFYWGQLAELYVPQSVQSIGEEAFAGSYINYLCFEGGDLPEIAPTAFDGVSISDVDLNWQASKAQMLAAQAFFDGIGQQARVWRMQNPHVDYVQDGLDVYDSGVMLGYSGTQTHIRPWDTYDGFDVTAVADYAFKDNQVIRYFSVPYSDVFTMIGIEAFAGSAVETVDLFDSVTLIDDGAFMDCKNLTELTIPASVTSVGEGVLKGCTALEKLVVLCDPAILPAGFAEGCTALKQVYAAPDATDEQVKALSRAAGMPWYLSACRLGETQKALIAMPDTPLDEADFWFDTEYARLDNYMGYELNLVLPRTAEGCELTAIGGSMMQRASSGDNYEVELPVRSVVIPETYREIPYYAFANCPTLETFVCYAPIETLPEGVFSGCTSLREVVFVNGVRHLDGYVFADCPALETVYLGECVETVSEYAFLEMDGSAAFDKARCITESAEMPDVAALLAAVRSEPIPAPTPAPEPEEMEPMPVGAEGEPYFGTWKLVSMEAEGVALDVAALGMAMDMTFSEDGTVTLWDGEESELALWVVVGDAAVVADEIVTIGGDGRLYLEGEGMKMAFARTDEPPAEQPANAQEAGQAQSGEKPERDLKARLGKKYICTSYTAMGNTLDAATLGAEYSMVFDENGKMDFCLSGVMMSDLPWGLETVSIGLEQAEAFVINYYGVEYVAVVTDTGFDMDYYGTMTLHFEAAE